MKRLDCFKVIKDIKTFKVLMVIAVIALMASCSKKDEYDFSGTIVDARQCTTMQLPGYVVALDKPADLGREYTLNGTTYPNAVILYEPGHQLYKGDHINGSFYLDDKYSRANCTLHWNDLKLPEGVFTSVSVD